jgi:benzylsuccinate CoA-transferase BbsF subunit
MQAGDDVSQATGLLSNVQVVELAQRISGPYCGKILAHLGADVIKIEPPEGDAARRLGPFPEHRPHPEKSGLFLWLNINKYGVTLDLTSAADRSQLQQLAKTADIIIANDAAGQIERLGLGYDVVAAVKPDIIMISSAGTGHSGPHKDYVAYGSLLQHYTGWNSISGYPEREPIKGGLWADPWVGMELAMITVAALHHRAVTDEGQYVDLSMAEALSASIPEAILDYQMNGTVPEPQGNRDAWDAPHGVYHCQGDDRWMAIAVTNDAEWQALCGVIDRPDLAADPRLVTAAGRRQYQDELDAAITAWTRQHQDYEAMHRLQAARIPAGPSLDIARVYQDPQLRAGGYLTPLQTSDGETRELPGLPWRFVDLEPLHITAAPVLGQHNTYVYQELLGLSETEMARLVEAQVIY